MAEYADHKDAGALRTIGEISAALRIKPHVLRYWEDQFPQLRPLKRAGGRRLYRPEDVAVIERIDQLVNRQHYTLKGAEAALKTPHESAESIVGEAGGDGRALLPRLKAIRDELAAALGT